MIYYVTYPYSFVHFKLVALGQLLQLNYIFMGASLFFALNSWTRKSHRPFFVATSDHIISYIWSCGSLTIWSWSASFWMCVGVTGIHIMVPSTCISSISKFFLASVLQKELISVGSWARVAALDVAKDLVNSHAAIFFWIYSRNKLGRNCPCRSCYRQHPTCRWSQ